MKIRRHLPLSLVLSASLALGACGSDDDSSPAESSAPATAETTAGTSAADTTAASDTTAVEPTTAGTAGSTTAPDDTTSVSIDPDGEFCTAAAEAESLGDGINAAAAAGPQELEEAVTAALAASDAAVAIAPAEIADEMARTLAFQQRFAEIVAASDWDTDAALATPEGRTLIQESADNDKDVDVVRAYLEANCGIEDDRDDPSSNPSLPEGEEGVRRFIQLYAMGAGVEVTQEQEDCFVQELEGKVEVEDLQVSLSGEAPEPVKLAIGAAVLACDIEVKRPTST